MRSLGEQRLLVVCNFTEQETAYQMPDELESGKGRVLISNYDRETLEPSATLAPYECAAVLYG